MDSITHEQTNERILQIYKYLQALDQIKNPVIRDIQLQPWRLWFKDLPTYETIHVGSSQDKEQEGSQNPFILKIQRPLLTEAPSPPTNYLSLLKDTWKKPEQKVHLHPGILAQEKDGEKLTEQELMENYLKEPEFAQWYEKRTLWAEKEIPVRKAMQVYNQIFELYARLEKESEQFELVLSDGMLHWDHATGLIHHPILLQRLKLEFNPAIPEFVLLETEYPLELYTALLRSVPEVNGTVLAHFQGELEEKSLSPLGRQETEAYFKKIITQLSPYGQYQQAGEKNNTEGAPTLVRAPLIFLRKRSLGFSKALEEILKDIPERTDLPGFLQNIVGVETASRNTLELELRRIDPNGEDENILLSKPANAEQLQIADRLKRSDAVLVQGPPGTGKSHIGIALGMGVMQQGYRVRFTSVMQLI